MFWQIVINRIKQLSWLYKCSGLKSNLVKKFKPVKTLHCLKLNIYFCATFFVWFVVDFSTEHFCWTFQSAQSACLLTLGLHKSQWTDSLNSLKAELYFHSYMSLTVLWKEDCETFVCYLPLTPCLVHSRSQRSVLQTCATQTMWLVTTSRVWSSSDPIEQEKCQHVNISSCLPTISTRKKSRVFRFLIQLLLQQHKPLFQRLIHHGGRKYTYIYVYPAITVVVHVLSYVLHVLHFESRGRYLDDLSPASCTWIST